MNIVVDIFGGDNAPQAIIEGCVQALEQHQDIHLILTGDQAIIENSLKAFSYDTNRVQIIHAPDCIGCDEAPTSAIKKKKNSSLVKALECVSNGQAECLVSAGSTGAVLAGATLIVRRQKGIKRPALAPVLPTRTGCVLLIDCGANVDCKPSYLQQFAVMGSAYMQHMFDLPSPRVGLLNNGAEKEKGNDLTKRAYPLLEQTPVNFVGNCEARDILSGQYDVIVCDGFAGNVVLKHTEGLAQTLIAMLKDELMSTTRSKIGAGLAKPAFKSFQKKMDYTEYGGAPLLGISGGIIKAHGSSNAKAICSALTQARQYIKSNVTQTIGDAILSLPNIDD